MHWGTSNHKFGQKLDVFTQTLTHHVLKSTTIATLELLQQSAYNNGILELITIGADQSFQSERRGNPSSITIRSHSEEPIPSQAQDQEPEEPP